MGTRLYPNTKNKKVLEALCMVQEGTYEELKASYAKHAQVMQDLNSAYLAAISCGANPNNIRVLMFEEEETHYNQIAENKDTKQLDNFLVFGWGKLTSQAAAIASELAEVHYGQVSCTIQTARMLKAQRVNLPKTISIKQVEGLCWN